MTLPAAPRTIFSDRPIRVAFLAGVCLFLATACFSGDGAFAPPDCTPQDTVTPQPDTGLFPDSTRPPPSIDPDPDVIACPPVDQ